MDRSTEVPKPCSCIPDGMDWFKKKKSLAADKERVAPPVGCHESGVFFQIYAVYSPDKTKVEPYLLMTRSAPLQKGFTVDPWWGAHTVGHDLTHHSYLECPGGRTQQFDEGSGYVKRFFPLDGKTKAEKDPRTVDETDHAPLESGAAAAARELIEETHGACAHPLHPKRTRQKYFDRTWYLPGALKTLAPNGDAVTSSTAVRVSVHFSTVEDMDAIRLRFRRANDEAFREYRRWAAANPDAGDDEHWERRPECSDLVFVRWMDFTNSVWMAARQLDAHYRLGGDDEKGEPKGHLMHLRDHRGVTHTSVLRAWTVNLFLPSSVLHSPVGQNAVSAVSHREIYEFVHESVQALCLHWACPVCVVDVLACSGKEYKYKAKYMDEHYSWRCGRCNEAPSWCPCPVLQCEMCDKLHHHFREAECTVPFEMPDGRKAVVCPECAEHINGHVRYI